MCKRTLPSLLLVIEISFVILIRWRERFKTEFSYALSFSPLSILNQIEEMRIKLVCDMIGKYELIRSQELILSYFRNIERIRSH